MSKIAVIGAGAWGTALAIALGRKNTHDVRLWAYEKEVVESVRARHTNDLFLAGCSIPHTVSATNDLGEAIKGAQFVLSVMPSHHARRLYQQMKPHLNSGMTFVSATKGIENDTFLRMSEVIQQVLQAAPGGFRPRLAALSGPSFAKEVAKGDPTAITVASADSGLTETVQREFSDPNFRVYSNDDPVGVELGGALKNIIAIAAGVVDGLGLGYNTAAALITRGIAEMTRLAVACGGNRETLAGLSGIGDLVLTCTGSLSRNRTVGQALGEGRKLPEILQSLGGKVAEGVLTSRAALELAREHEIEMPITEQMELILEHDKDPREAIRELMLRPGKGEH